MTELQARLMKTANDATMMAVCQAGWCLENGNWLYKQWGPAWKELRPTSREPMTPAALQAVIIEILADIKEPGVLHTSEVPSLSGPGSGHGADGGAQGGVLRNPDLATNCWRTAAQQPDEVVRQHGVSTASEPVAAGKSPSTRNGQTPGTPIVQSATPLQLRNAGNGNTGYVNALVHIITWLLESTGLEVNCLGTGQQAWRTITVHRKACNVLQLFP